VADPVAVVVANAVVAVAEGQVTAAAVAGKITGLMATVGVAMITVPLLTVAIAAITAVVHISLTEEITINYNNYCLD
jgi:hypothetical protein